MTGTASSAGAAPVVETDRLLLRELVPEDAPFILALVNDPDWLRFIGDRGIRTLEDARAYIVDGPMAMYARLGFGLWLVAVKPGLEPAGICGLIERDALEDVDVGFAFLPGFRGAGYAFEAASATLAHGRKALGLDRIVAIVSPGNEVSIRLLHRLGMRPEKRIRLADDAEELCQIGRAHV